MGHMPPIDNAARKVHTVAPKITLAMVLCGVVWAAGIGAANAATAPAASPAIAIKYNPAALQTDRGAQQIYNQLANAAAELYPSSSPHWVPSQVREWREQSIARAVMTINSPKLAAVYNSTVRND
jgi:UrcA family protein